MDDGRTDMQIEDCITISIPGDCVNVTITSAEAAIDMELDESAMMWLLSRLVDAAKVVWPRE